jgi:hypothetical protein
MGAIVQAMIRIKKRDQNVYIEKRTHVLLYIILFH